MDLRRLSQQQFFIRTHLEVFSSPGSNGRVHYAGTVVYAFLPVTHLPVSPHPLAGAQLETLHL